MTLPFPRTAAAALAAALATALAGCASLAPPHEPPPLPTPEAWPAHLQAGAQGVAAAGLPWREYFTDPALRQLIATALEHNRDLRVAALRAEEARAAFQIQRSELFPAIGVGGQAARARVPGDLNLSGRSVVSGEYRAEVGFSSWELDLWGRVRSLKDAALQTWLASDAGRHAVQTALIAQVADGYLGLRELDERVAIARETLATRQESFRIFTRREAVGASSRLQLAQVQTLLTQAQALLAQLVGAHPGPLPAAAPFDDALVLAELRPGLPSELLTARPDIAAAEHQLRAARAQIGAARAAFFPRIALTARWGTASAELDGLFDGGSRAWAFVPTVSLPIFDGGRRRANLELGEIRSDMAVAQYEKAIQTAFREVADGLAARRWLSEQITVQRTAVQAQAERARLAQLRYDNGSAAYLEVLDAQRDLLAARQQLVQARRALLSSQVGLYAALGGGSGAEPAALPATLPATPADPPNS